MKQGIRKWIHFFKNFNIFLWNISKIWKYFLKNFEIFTKNILKIENFQFCGASLQLQRIFLWKELLNLDLIKNVNKIFYIDPEGTSGMEMKILQICGKMQENEPLMNIFHQTWKFCTIRPKMKKFSNVPKKILRFLIKSLWKIDFFTMLAKFFWDFCFFFESIYPSKITHKFSLAIFRLLVGGRSCFPLSRRLGFMSILNKIFNSFSETFGDIGNLIKIFRWMGSLR